MNDQTNPNHDSGQIFADAHDEGLLSKNALTVLTSGDVAQQINASLGQSTFLANASEIILLNILVDDSGSISAAGNEQAIRDGHNEILKAVEESKQGDNIYVHTRYLNGETINSWALIQNAVRLDTLNYAGTGITPLYDMSKVFLGTVLAEALRYYNDGLPVRTITIIITDGHDQGSDIQEGGQGTKPEDVKSFVDDMLESEMPAHIIGAMGIDDGFTDFTKIFTEMGLKPQWILTPDNDPSSIRKACGVFSKSAATASQSGADFSKTADVGLAGFMNN